MNPRDAKILLIEDDLITVEMYRLKFRVSGLTLYTALTAEDGLGMIQEIKPHLILLDIKLDDTDGFEILEKMKSQEETKHIPIYLLTNVREKDNKEKGERLGAEDFIMKTKVKPDEIVKIVSEKLESL